MVWLYLCLIALLLIAGQATHGWIRRPTHLDAIPLLDAQQLAYLRYGNLGGVRTAVAQLVLRGVLVVDTNRAILLERDSFPPGVSQLERLVLRKLHQGMSLEQLFGCEAITEDVRKRLRELRLLQVKQERALRCSLPTAILLMILFVVLGVASEALPSSQFAWAINLWRNVLRLFFIFNAGLFIFGIPLIGDFNQERTRWGDCVCDFYKNHYDLDDPLQRVAMEGSSAMTDGILFDLRSLFNPAENAYYRE